MAAFLFSGSHMSTNFVSCIEDFEQDRVLVWERPIDGGVRTLKTYKPPRYFYIEDEHGEFETITKKKVRKLEFDDGFEFNKYVRAALDAGVAYESDIRPDSRILMNEYFGRKTPVINYAFIDIEVDVKKSSGWATPKNAYAPINGLTVWQSWSNSFKCYAVPPKQWPESERETFTVDVEQYAKEHSLAFIPEFVLCRNEEELLSNFINDIQDADLLSGWNSELFDIPYIVARLKTVYGERGPNKLCFPGAGSPRMRTVEVFGNEEIAYELKGRSHVDYMDAFKKFTFEGRTSYSLANIAAEELDIDKIDTGLSFEELYNKHFYKFCVYNARDVEILRDLDRKFRFIQLINQMAHENTVPYSAIMGTVRYVDMGITNRVHKVHNKVSINKPKIDDSVDLGKVEGAVVFDPLFGLWKWVGSVDINSLYPSVIRALNMSYETYIGQFHGEWADWRGIMDDRKRVVSKCPNGLRNIRYRDEKELAFDFSDREYSMLHVSGEVITKTASEWRKWFKDNNYAISAFGTVFDQNQEGVVAETLTFWFSERKRLQAEKKKWGKVIMSILTNKGHDVETHEYKHKYSFKTDAGKQTKFYNDVEWKELFDAKREEEHYDLLQLTKKIQLNSTYGALLNKAFRYNRRELGASTTGTGREITIFMAETIGETLSGEHTEVMKYQTVGSKNKIENHYCCTNDFIIYGDTDSVAGDTIVETDAFGKTTIAELFDKLPAKQVCGEKQYATMDGLHTPCFDNGEVSQKPVLAVYRHKVSKKKWKLTASNGKVVYMTEDHSAMVIRDGVLTEVKPVEIRKTDKLVGIKNEKS